MTLYYYMCRSWQDCCRRRENRSWPSVSAESVDSECWFLNAIFYAFIMGLIVEKRVFILESYLKTMSYAHCRQSFFEKFRRQAPVKSAIAIILRLRGITAWRSVVGPNIPAMNGRDTWRYWHCMACHMLVPKSKDETFNIVPICLPWNLTLLNSHYSKCVKWTWSLKKIYV